jgi:cephalosporin-C deacetylase-like acetyl esterase
VSGWPKWLNRVAGERRTRVLETSAYFDGVNFARKFKGKSLYGIGFIDPVLAPTTAYSAFNVLTGPKKITSPLALPWFDPRWIEARNNFWKAHLALRPPAE